MDNGGREKEQGGVEDAGGRRKREEGILKEVKATGESRFPQHSVEPLAQAWRASLTFCICLCRSKQLCSSTTGCEVVEGEVQEEPGCTL
jgi:hypothetical protein